MPTFKFSKPSLAKLDTCHPVLKLLMTRVLDVSPHDMTVLCGHRGETQQNDAYSKGNSKLKWPQSKHNLLPSLAVDVAPYPVDWNNIDSFKQLSVIVKSVWDEMTDDERDGWHLMYGGDWKMRDYPHWQITR
jgi:peptidoglycan L-alanyl-D-glutamate endopeptidase CwlK